jgi:hypothetical protein
MDEAEAREIARHLERECRVCEAFLESCGSADALDGQVDGALAALSPEEGAAGHDLEFARIERALRTPSPHRRLAPQIALAAAVAVAGVAGLLATRLRPDEAAWTGEKGVARSVPLRLRFVVIEGLPARPGAVKGASGEVVDAAASLQFEVELGRPADVALVRIPATSAPEPFFRERLRAGRTGVTVGGAPAAYPLRDLAGPQRFVAIASEAPLDAERIARAAAALAPPGHLAPDAPALDGLSVDVAEVTVR